MMEKLNDVIKEIKDHVHETGVHGSSRKDEIKVMKAMLNDPDFIVVNPSDPGNKNLYYSPGGDMRETITKVISSTTKIPKAEAHELMNNYDFTTSDAQTFVNVSKEFNNTYLDTERKLSFGKREDRDITIMGVPKGESTRTYPAKNEDGNYIKKQVTVPAHMGIKASAKPVK